MRESGGGRATIGPPMSELGLNMESLSNLGEQFVPVTRGEWEWERKVTYWLVLGQNLEMDSLPCLFCLTRPYSLAISFVFLPTNVHRNFNRLKKGTAKL